MIKLIVAGILALGFWQQPDLSVLIESDPKAKEILDQTSTVFKDLTSLKANLDITMSIPNQEAYEQKAIVYIKGESYRMELEDEVIICDNKSVWRYLKDMNEVQITDYEPADDEITPTNIFNIYENDFYYQYAQLVKIESNEFHVIDLTPMDKEKSFFKVKLWVSTTDSFIHKMKVFDKNGSKYIYELNDLVKNGTYKDNVFQFDKADYPDVYIEDLRF